MSSPLRKRKPTLWFGAFLLCSVGCGPAENPQRGSDETGPAEVFDALESRLLEAGTVRLDFQAIANGVIEADLRGSLEINPRGETQLIAVGQFDGQPVDLLLQARDEQYRLENGTERTTANRPTYLEEALLIGLTRMGVLHNLARLVGTASPDHADGGVREWVLVSAFARVADDPTSVSFELTVAGEPAGSASLELDSLGRPAVRRQTVQFSSGEMRVVEQYTAVTIAP